MHSINDDYFVDNIDKIEGHVHNDNNRKFYVRHMIFKVKNSKKYSDKCVL